MKELKPDHRIKMFEESSKSHASKNIFVQILIFLIVFFLIYILQSLIAYVIALPDIMKEIGKDNDVLQGTKKVTYSYSKEVTYDIFGRTKGRLILLFSTLIGTVSSIFYCRCIEMRKVSSMGARKRKLVKHYLGGLVVGAVMMTVITLLTVVSGANSIKLCTGINFGIIALYFLGFFFQGMSEEFIFRGYLMNTVGGANSPAIAIGVSSVAFGLAHISNPGINVLAMTNLILFGVFAAVYMIYFDDIWGGCAIHSIWNFTQGNLYGISVSGSGDSESVFRTSAKSSHTFLTGGDFGIEGSIFTTIVLLSGLAVVAFLIKKNGIAATKNTNETKSS